MTKPYLEKLAGRETPYTPFWLMRQAGRYLPEYRAIREKAGGFWNLVYNPDIAAEVTLQPLHRFKMDAAILFADILVLPHALGQSITFGAGEGPKLEPVRSIDDMKRLNPALLPQHVAPVCETVSRVVAGLPDGATMIGFAGSPWTIAAYMIEGQGSKDFTIAKSIAHQDPNFMEALLDLITSTTATYCLAQIRAGAEAIQLFDSWAGTLNENDFVNWVIKPTRRLVQLIKDQAPHVPIIGFPRGGGAHLAEYAQKTKITALQLDTSVTLSTAQKLADILPVQGWLDPALLVAGGDALLNEIDRMKEGMKGRSWIFNLGHGIVPQTNPDHVQMLAERLRT